MMLRIPNYCVRLLSLLFFLLVSPEAFAAPDTVTAQLAPSRTSGKAPLLVFFDATASTDADTAKPIHHLTYCFNAGDGNTDVYNLAGHKTTKKAEFCGAPLFAYIYETPGTYTARVTATSADGDQSTKTITVNVQGWSGAETRCVSDNGDFSGCPVCSSANGASCIIDADFDRSIADAISSGRKRILFRPNGTFSASTPISLNTDGVYIGSFDGTTKYQLTGAPQPLFFANSDDVRVNDGIWTSNGSNNDDFMRTKMRSPYADNLLIQNWNVHNLAYFLLVNLSAADGDLPNNIGVFDSKATKCAQSLQCIATAAHNVALVNNVLDGGVGGANSHLIRHFHAENVFDHNIKVLNPLKDKTNLTVRAADWNGGFGGISNRWAENAFVSDSWFIGRTTWPVQCCADNGPLGPTTKHRNHIFERNYFTFGTNSSDCGGGSNDTCDTHFRLGTGGGGGSETNHVTLRNNIFDLSGGEFFSSAIQSSITTGAEIINNSVYSDSGSDRKFHDAPAGAVTLKNNVAWENDGKLWFVKNGTPGASSNNFDPDGDEAGVAKLSQCPFTACPPSSVDEFKIKASDPDGLVDGGASVANLLDFGQNTRPLGSPLDVGAWELQSVSGTPLDPPSNLRIIGVAP